jgi:hypothetical protein
VPSDELRAAVEQDEELCALIERLQVDPDGAEMLVRAVTSGDDSLVREALGLSRQDADLLARLLYVRALEYAARFPEWFDAASFLRGEDRSSD